MKAMITLKAKTLRKPTNGENFGSNMTVKVQEKLFGCNTVANFKLNWGKSNRIFVGGVYYSTALIMLICLAWDTMLQISECYHTTGGVGGRLKMNGREKINARVPV